MFAVLFLPLSSDNVYPVGWVISVQADCRTCLGGFADAMPSGGLGQKREEASDDWRKQG